MRFSRNARIVAVVIAVFFMTQTLKEALPAPEGPAPVRIDSAERHKALPLFVEPPSWWQAVELDEGWSTSVGSVSRGVLVGGIPFPPRGPGFILNSRRPNKKGRYATVEVVKAVLEAAAQTTKRHGGRPVMINDLAFKEGGKIPHHGSHRAGRDLDTLFYLFDAKGRSTRGRGVIVDPRGEGWDFGDLSDPKDDVRYEFDAARTWGFLRALVEQPHAQLQRIFIAEHIRTLLMEHAKKTRTPKWVVERIGHLTCQPGTPHDDHIHLRFFCSIEDLGQGCEDIYPVYPWHRKYLAEHETEPVIAEPVAAPKEGKKPTPRRYWQPELPANADARVKKLWAERAEWIVPPHPGRPYCR